MDINIDSAQDYIVDYLEDSDCDPIDWDVSGMASELVDWVDGDNAVSFGDVPADVFSEMLDVYAL